MFQSVAIVPAAGLGKRMGGAKLLLPWQGKTIIEHVIGAWRASRVEHVIAVCRPDDRPLQEVCQRAQATVVIPELAPPEMKDSVRVALQYATQQWRMGADDAWLLAPADMPHLAPEIVNQLLAAHPRYPAAIVVPTLAGKRGHPVLFPWQLAREIDQLSAHEGVNRLLKRHPVIELPVEEPGILTDLDTPADYERLQDESSKPTA